MSITRIGLVGCGDWGRHHLRDLIELGCEVEVVARSAESIDRARSGAADKVVARHQDLGDVDGLIVATPDSDHARTVRELLARGVPIATQKPFTLDPASADELATLAPDQIFVLQLWRYHPGVEAIADLARGGELGSLQGVRSLRWAWGQKRPTSDPTYHLAPHDLSIGLEIIGMLPEPREARVGLLDGKPTDLVALLGGAPTDPERGEPWLLVDVSTTRRQRLREVRAQFSGGVACLDGAYESRISVSRSAQQRDPEWVNVSDEMPMRRELRAFVDHVRGAGPAPKTSAWDGALLVRRLAQLRELAGLPAALPEL